MSYSFQDRLGSKFGPPIENEKNRILSVQLIYMGYAACETAIPRTALVTYSILMNLKISYSHHTTIFAFGRTKCSTFQLGHLVLV